jgi:hypothetical protein
MFISQITYTNCAEIKFLFHAKCRPKNHSEKISKSNEIADKEKHNVVKINSQKKLGKHPKVLMKYRFHYFDFHNAY